MQKKNLIRIIRVAVVAASILAAAFLFSSIQDKSTSRDISKESVGGGVAGIPIGGPFTLTDHNGRTVTDKDFSGAYKLIYFGFTFCPAICPTELQKISRALNILGDKAKDIRPIFITVDPERDTAGVLHEYVGLFHPALVGLTGTRAQIDSVLKAWHVYAAKAQSENLSDYTMDHSSFIYFMGPDDRLIAIYRTQDKAEDIAADILPRLK